MSNRDAIQNDANDLIRPETKSGLSVCMGVGKTLIGLRDQTAQYTDISKFLVVAPKKSIFQSWEDERQKWGMIYLKDHTDESTYRSLTKQSFDYDTVYLDECHSLTPAHEQWLDDYLAQGGRIVGLTGTYPNNAYSDKGKLCRKFCPLVYTYGINDAIRDGILNDYRITIHLLSIGSNKTVKKSGKFGDYFTSEKADYDYWTNRIAALDQKREMGLHYNKGHLMQARLQRMKAMHGYPSKAAYAKKLLTSKKEKTILFTPLIKDAKNICEHSYHSKNPNSEENLDAFKKGEILNLSTVEQIAEGITIPNLKNGIITNTYSNNRKASQKIGRMLRLNPDDTCHIDILCYIDTVDVDWVQSALEEYSFEKITWKNV